MVESGSELHSDCRDDLNRYVSELIGRKRRTGIGESGAYGVVQPAPMDVFGTDEGLESGKTPSRSQRHKSRTLLVAKMTLYASGQPLGNKVGDGAGIPAKIRGNVGFAFDRID